MYKALKAWINVPIQVKSLVRYTGSGEKVYSDPVDHLCYPEGRAVMVTNAEGSSVVSQRQLYMFGTATIQLTDAIIFEGKEYEVQATSPFYRKGKVDIWVVYI